MQQHWLNKNNNKTLVIFFGGWSFDYKPFECLISGENDILMFYDYTDLALNMPDLSNYTEINLVAWSMGVFIAYYIKNKLPEFRNKIAINGTPYPVSDTKGIPNRTFDLTLKYAETGLAGKFYQNVFSNDDWLEKYKTIPVERSIENRVNELISLDKLIKNTDLTYDNEYYTKALIGKTDKIIPPKNQHNCWGEKAIMLDCGHFPFYNFESWDEIIQCS